MTLNRPPQPLLRSALYVPGNKPDWMAKAPRYGADALIFDLEDSVPPSQKAEARQMVARAIEALHHQPIEGHKPRIFVRVNPVESGLTEEDLRAVVQPGLFGVCLPKDRGPEDVACVDEWLGRLEGQANLEVGLIIIRPALESARALREAYEVAMASPRVGYIGAGAGGDGDYARALGYRETPNRLETLYIRSKVLLDARAAGIPTPLGALWMKVHELEGLRRFAEEIRDLGYAGMQAIHPTHVPIINEVFSPSAEEVERLRGIVQAVEEAEARGSSAALYDGRMVDIAHLTYARELLSRLDTG